MHRSIFEPPPEPPTGDQLIYRAILGTVDGDRLWSVLNPAGGSGWRNADDVLGSLSADDYDALAQFSEYDARTVASIRFIKDRIDSGRITWEGGWGEIEVDGVRVFPPRPKLSSDELIYRAILGDVDGAWFTGAMRRSAGGWTTGDVIGALSAKDRDGMAHFSEKTQDIKDMLRRIKRSIDAGRTTRGGSAGNSIIVDGVDVLRGA